MQKHVYIYMYIHTLKSTYMFIKMQTFYNLFFFTQYIENIFPFQLTHPFFKLGYIILYMCVIVHLLNSLMGISVNFMNIFFIFLVVTIKLLTHVFKVNKQPKKKKNPRSEINLWLLPRQEKKFKTLHY